MSYASDQSVLNAQFNAALLSQEAETKRMAPHVLLRPSILPDGTMWCALLGEDLMVGIAGFGETPELACQAFRSAKTPAAAMGEDMTGDKDLAAKIEALLQSAKQQVSADAMLPAVVNDIRVRMALLNSYRRRLVAKINAEKRPEERIRMDREVDKIDHELEGLAAKPKRAG
jgi:hypothetical protein